MNAFALRSTVLIWAAVAGLGWGGDVPLKSFDWSALNKKAAEEYLQAVRPGLPGKSPFWNVAAKQFTYAPAFDIEEAQGAARYKLQATDLASGKVYVAMQEKPWAPVVELWRQLPATAVRLEAFAVDEKGDVIKQLSIRGRETREFCRRPGFHGPYANPIRSYRECALLSLKRVFEFCKTSKIAETGKADPKIYGYFCYPNKMLAALMTGMCRYAALVPAEREEALRQARAAGDALIALSAPETAPLAFLPPTYQGELYSAKGQNAIVQMTEPISAISAYLDVFEATKENRYRDAAMKIVETYGRLQLPDGSWYLKINGQTGKPVTMNKLIPESFLPLSHRLEALGCAQAKTMREKALPWLMEQVVAPFNWEGQFEDVGPSQHYRNLANYQAIFTARYLLRHRAENPECRKLAEEMIRYAEDQFVLWDRCSVPENKAKEFKPSVMNGWLLPLAQEQYGWMQGINASAATLIFGWLTMYQATGDELWLAKASSMGNIMTLSQRPSGELPTYWSTNGELKDDNWINCEVWATLAMLELAEAYESWEGKK
ncbi:MAG TPA: hypothetical protein VGP72_23520 [Planctomycetota bacterium]